MSLNKMLKFTLLPFTLILLSGCIVQVDPDAWDWDDGYDNRHRHGDRHHIDKVFGSIHVDEGENVGHVESVNGSITLRDNSTADKVEAVNGSIRIHDQVSVFSVETTNGSIRGGENLTVEDDLETVNGRIELRQGSVIKEDVRTVNGTIQLRATEVGNNVETVNGDIKILRGSVVSGDVVFEDNNGWFQRSVNRPTLVVDADSAIKGTVHLYRKVDLEIDENAEVARVVEHY